MSKGQYDSIRYVGQEVHSALRRFLDGRGYPVGIRHRDDVESQETVLFYTMMGTTDVRVVISKNKDDKNYHFNVQVGPKDSTELETMVNKDVHLKRGKQGKLKPAIIEALAQESFEQFRQYSKRVSHAPTKL